MSTIRSYRSDHPIEALDLMGEEAQFSTLHIALAAYDWHLAVEDEQGRMSRWVRVRTSGSSHPRNLKVIIALQQLWDALREEDEETDETVSR